MKLSRAILQHIKVAAMHGEPMSVSHLRQYCAFTFCQLCVKCGHSSLASVVMSSPRLQEKLEEGLSSFVCPAKHWNFQSGTAETLPKRLLTWGRLYAELAASHFCVFALQSAAPDSFVLHPNCKCLNLCFHPRQLLLEWVGTVLEL